MRAQAADEGVQVATEECQAGPDGGPEEAGAEDGTVAVLAGAAVVVVPKVVTGGYFSSGPEAPLRTIQSSPRPWSDSLLGSRTPSSRVNMRGRAWRFDLE